MFDQQHIRGSDFAEMEERKKLRKVAGSASSGGSRG